MSLFGLVGSHKTLRAKKNTPVGSKVRVVEVGVRAEGGFGGAVAALRVLLAAPIFFVSSTCRKDRSCMHKC